MLVEQSHSVSSSNRNSAGGNDKIKLMLIYIHEHYPENLSVKELAAAAYTSERECYRIFREHLHTTPIAYLTAYRIQIACQMLAESKASITEVGTACGMGNSIFKETYDVALDKNTYEIRFCELISASLTCFYYNRQE